MRKIFLILSLFLLCITSVNAVNFGTYKTETEYGLIDGFKWNFFNRDKDTPLVQLKSETKEEIERLEREKNKPKEEINEAQMYRFMLENVSTF